MSTPQCWQMVIFRRFHFWKELLIKWKYKTILHISTYLIQVSKHSLTCSWKCEQLTHWNERKFSSNKVNERNCSTRSRSRRWRSFNGSRPGSPFGLLSINLTNSCVAIETACPGGSSLCANTNITAWLLVILQWWTRFTCE